MEIIIHYMILGTLFAKLAGKAGLDVQDPKYKDVVGSQLEVHDEDANKITTALLSIDDAKNNHALKTYFWSQALDGTDREIAKQLEELGIAVEDRTEIESEKNTIKKVGLLTKKVQSLESKKAGATNKEKAELQKEINDKQAQIATLIEDHKTNVKQINSEWQGKLTNSTIKSILAGKKYSNKDIPQDVNVETAMIFINKELQKSGAKIVNQDGILTLKQAKDESLDWYSPANEKLSFEQFVDSTLATNKLLAVNDPEKETPSNQGGNGQTRTVISSGGNGRYNANQDFNSVLQNQLKEMENSPVQ